MTDALFAINYNASHLPCTYIRVKAGSDFGAVVEHIRKTVHEIDPTYPVDVEFYDTILNNFYQEENRVTRMVYSFSFLAIVISLMGVFSLVLFETQYRRKEIGIRRVMGASVVVWAALYLDCYTERIPGGSAGLLGGLVVAESLRLQDRYADLGVPLGGRGGLVGDVVGCLDPLLAYGQ